MSLRASAGFAKDQFRREVRDGADQGACAGCRRHGAREAEVADLDPAVVGDQDVLRLDVAVDHAGGMGGPEAFHHRIDECQGQPGGQGALAVDDVAEGVPLDVLHHEVGGVSVVPLVEDAHHMGV